MPNDSLPTDPTASSVTALLTAARADRLAHIVDNRNAYDGARRLARIRLEAEIAGQLEALEGRP